MGMLIPKVLREDILPYVNDVVAERGNIARAAKHLNMDEGILGNIVRGTRYWDKKPIVYIDYYQADRLMTAMDKVHIMHQLEVHMRPLRRSGWEDE